MRWCNLDELMFIFLSKSYKNLGTIAGEEEQWSGETRQPGSIFYPHTTNVHVMLRKESDYSSAACAEYLWLRYSIKSKCQTHCSTSAVWSARLASLAPLYICSTVCWLGRLFTWEVDLHLTKLLVLKSEQVKSFKTGQRVRGRLLSVAALVQLQSKQSGVNGAWEMSHQLCAGCVSLCASLSLLNIRSPEGPRHHRHTSAITFSPTRCQSHGS